MAYKDPEKSREAKREHYRNNRERYLERNKARVLEMKQYIWKVKNVPCMDCKVQYDPWVMEFDHRNPKEKIANINPLIRNGSWAKLIEEIEKCDVVCANCHRIRTAKHFGWSFDNPDLLC